MNSISTTHNLAFTRSRGKKQDTCSLLFQFILSFHWQINYLIHYINSSSNKSIPKLGFWGFGVLSFIQPHWSFRTKAGIRPTKWVGQETGTRRWSISIKVWEAYKVAVWLHSAIYSTGTSHLFDTRKWSINKFAGICLLKANRNCTHSYKAWGWKPIADC